MNENFDVTYKSLFRRYYPNLIFYATRLVGEEEAEDVVQDVFVELLDFFAMLQVIVQDS